MSGRERAPTGASERPGIFGNPVSDRMSQSWETGISPRKESCINDAPVGFGNIEATTRRSLSSGRRRRPIASRESEDGSNNQGSVQGVEPPTEGRLQTSGRCVKLELTFRHPQVWVERARSGASGINRVTDEEKENHDHGEDMLELEHIIGYTGHFKQNVVAHPEDSSVMIKVMGSLLVIGAVADPHQQYLLRGHDMEISALALSHSGSLIATGQCGSTRRKGYPAPVFLWDFATRTCLHVFEGFSEGVQHLSFSTDQRFLLGCGGNNLVYVWDTNTGELIIGKSYTESATLAEWTSVKQCGRRTVYDICLCIGNDIVALEMKFDPARRQWTLSGGPMSTPSAGLRRRYHCSTLHDGGKFLLCGTDVGDLVVFGVEAKVFRASVPVSSGGVLSVCTDHATGAVFCGGGNGVLRKIIGTDMVWQQETETRLDGGVIALSVQADGCELLAGTQQGSVYRLLLADLSTSKISSWQKSAVVCVACGPRVDTFATCAKDGTVRVWDLCDYAVVTEPSERPRGGDGGGGSALCISWLGEEAIITGWADCFVRCHDAGTGVLRWEIPRAHRAAVTCCAVRSDASAAFLVTGSEDGSVNVWELYTRELLLDFSEHQKGVRAVLVDVTQPHLVHSVGEDCTVLTYDLRKERRTIVHMTRAGAFQSMTQRLDSENELITCDIHGRLLTWDCDFREPVQALQDPSHERISSLSMSPSGRYLALGGDEETIKVLDLANNCEAVACGRAHAGAITSVQWTKDERQLLSAAEDCTLAIWNFYGTSANPVAERSTSSDRQR